MEDAAIRLNKRCVRVRVSAAHRTWQGADEAHKTQTDASRFLLSKPALQLLAGDQNTQWHTGSHCMQLCHFMSQSHLWDVLKENKEVERWEVGRERGDGGRGVAIVLERLLLCSVALICFFPCSPARSFDPLSDHPLDDSLTAKEIKYIGLTLRHQWLAPHLLPPLFPEAVISLTDKQWIGSLSLLSHQYPFFLPSFPSSVPPPFLRRDLIPASQWMHVRDVIPLFNMLFWAPTPPQTQSLAGLHAYSSALKKTKDRSHCLSCTTSRTIQFSLSSLQLLGD